MPGAVLGLSDVPAGGVIAGGGANPDGRAPAGSMSSGRRVSGRVPAAGSTGSITIPVDRK
jgi:hypothetical protein